MKQQQFENLYRQDWQAFGEQLEQVEKHPTQVLSPHFARDYRRICQHHAVSKSRHYSSYLVDELDQMVLRGHRVLYRRKTYFAQAILRFLVTDFPRQVRAQGRLVWLTTAFFYLPALCLALAQLWQPDLIYSLFPPPQVQEMEAMYDPSNITLGEARESPTNWLMFGFYIQNNVGLAFRTFAAGLLAGVGSLVFVVYNGLMLGAVATHLNALGSGTTFFAFVVGHGSFELTAIIIAGAAGLKLGLSLLHPGQVSRLVALRQASGPAIDLIMGAMVFLLIAAFIEAFWSSNNMLAPWQKFGMGGLLWLLVIAYLSLAGKTYGPR